MAQARVGRGSFDFKFAVFADDFAFCVQFLNDESRRVARVLAEAFAAQVGGARPNEGGVLGVRFDFDILIDARVPVAVGMRANRALAAVEFGQPPIRMTDVVRFLPDVTLHRTQKLVSPTGEDRPCATIAHHARDRFFKARIHQEIAGRFGNVRRDGRRPFAAVARSDFNRLHERLALRHHFAFLHARAREADFNDAVARSDVVEHEVNRSMCAARRCRDVEVFHDQFAVDFDAEAILLRVYSARSGELEADVIM